MSKKEIEDLKEAIRVLQVKITLNSADEKYTPGHGGHPLDIGIIRDQEKLDQMKADLLKLEPVKQSKKESKKESKRK